MQRGSRVGGRTSGEPQPFAGKLSFQSFHKLLPDPLLLQEGRKQTRAERLCEPGLVLGTQL